MATISARQRSTLPDGGWGWVVVFGCAVHTFVTGGLFQYLTLIYEDLRERFDSSATATAWAFSIHSCVSTMFAPVTSALVTHFGCRPVVMLGSVLLTLGILGMAYATSLPVVYLSFGVVSGIGNGLIMTSKFIVISHWFESRRGRATSLATMMDGFGAMAIAPLLQMAQRHFGHQGSLVILAGFILQCLVGAALLRMPFTWEYTPPCNLEQDYIEEDESSFEFERIGAYRMESNTSDAYDRKSTSVSVLTPNVHLLNASILSDYTGSVDEIYLGMPRRLSLSCNALETIKHQQNSLSKRRKTVSLEEFTLATVCGIDDVPSDRMMLDIRDDTDSDREWTSDSACDIVVQESTNNNHHTKERFKVIQSKVVRYFDYRLLIDSNYLAFTLLAVTFILGASMRGTHFAGLCKEKHMSEGEIVTLLVVLGGINTALKFLSGFLFDWPPVRKHRKHVYFATSIIFGAMLVISPQVSTLPGIYAVWIIFISAGTIMVTQESIILADLVSHNSFPSAIGINRFFRSFGALSGPTFGGFLKDTTGVYDSTFITAGAAVIFAAFVFQIVTSWKRLKTLICDRNKTASCNT